MFGWPQVVGRKIKMEKVTVIIGEYVVFSWQCESVKFDHKINCSSNLKIILFLLKFTIKNQNV